jgi:hypothetical protein
MVASRAGSKACTKAVRWDAATVEHSVHHSVASRAGLRVLWKVVLKVVCSVSIWVGNLECWWAVLWACWKVDQKDHSRVVLMAVWMALLLVDDLAETWENFSVVSLVRSMGLKSAVSMVYWWAVLKVR